MVHGRSPLGYLRGLRAIMFFIPLMTLLTLGMGGRRFNGAFINPDSLGEIKPIIVPLFIATAVLVALAARMKPESNRVGRYVMICLAYLVTMVTFWFAAAYSLAGASWGWTVAGFVAAVVAAKAVSLARLAHDVSTDWY
jgi:hypothetical protein